MGVAGNVYALDLRFAGGKLACDLDEVQPSKAADSKTINIRWDTDFNGCPLLGGVVSVELPVGYEKFEHKNVQIQPAGEGENYFWDHTLKLHSLGKGRTIAEFSRLMSHCWHNLSTNWRVKTIIFDRTVLFS